MRFDGVIKTWDDERGLGTIEPLPDGDEIAVHITAFPRGQPRPRVKQRVSFEVELGHDGRKHARGVHIRETGQPPRTVSRSVRPAAPAWPGLLALLLFLALYGTAALSWTVSPSVGIAYVAASLLAFGAAARDQAAARARRARLPDGVWMLLALACGWPGLVLALPVLGHEPGQRLPRRSLWLAVGINIVAFAFLTSPLGRAWR